MASLSREFWVVAFYLSKFGNAISGNKVAPPVELETKNWNEAYKIFYKKFGDGKTIKSFINSLKNCRDTFDGHIENSKRKGWRDLNNKPVKLQSLAKSVFSRYNNVDRDVLWNEINEILSSKSTKPIKESSITTNESRGLNKKKGLNNPNWNREELILALDLYFNMDYGQMHGKNLSIIQLSTDLRNLGIHSNIPNKQKFRSVNSIALKLANLKKLDHNFKGRGMRDGGKLEKEVWNQYSNHRDTLKKEANLIRQLYLKPGLKTVPSQSERKSYLKSDFLFQYHKSKESDPLINKVKKETVLANFKALKCEVCGFDSVAFYGELGNDFMEIHFRKEFKDEPILGLDSMEDYIIVCCNCHKALDKNFGLLNADDLKIIINKR